MDNKNYKIGKKVADDKIEEKIEKHDTLNPKLFGSDNKLKPEVKDKILEIVNFFINNLQEDGIKFDLADVVLVGSNCSYNYTPDSDLDIHIRYKEDGLQCPDNLYPLLYSAYRSIFNGKYDIDFYGIEAELFTEPENGGTLVSNGIYSVLNDEWIKEPEVRDIPEINQEEIDAEVAKWVERFNKIAGESETNFNTDKNENLNEESNENKDHFISSSSLKELSNIYLYNLKTQLSNYQEMSLEDIVKAGVKDKITYNGKPVVAELIKGGNYALYFTDENGSIYSSDTSDGKAIVHINDKIKNGEELKNFLLNGEIPMSTSDLSISDIDSDFDSADLLDVDTLPTSEFRAKYDDLTSLWHNAAEDFLKKLSIGKTYSYKNIEKYDYTSRGSNIIAYNTINILKQGDDKFYIWYSKGNKKGETETHNLKDTAKVLYKFVDANRGRHNKLIDITDDPTNSEYVDSYASSMDNTDWTHRSLIKNNSGKDIYRKRKYDDEKLAKMAADWLIDNSDDDDFEDGWSPRGFIVTDGRISANDGGQRHGNIDRELFKWLRDQGFEISKDDFDDYDSGAQGSLLGDILGFIRVNGSGENYVTVPKKVPTDAQLRALAEWIDGFFEYTDYDTPIHVVTYDGHQVAYNPDEYKGSEIISKIRNYYNTGSLREKIEENFKLKKQK